MTWLREVKAIEATRWTVVFHRKAENRFFSLIAMGHFKHVSAIAWLPEIGVWILYDVGFRKTSLKLIEDSAFAKATIANLLEGNAVVTMPVRDDALPLMRAGMFCTSAIKHLIGLRSSALRPSALFRDCLRSGGILHPEKPDASFKKSPAAGVAEGTI